MNVLKSSGKLLIFLAVLFLSISFLFTRENCGHPDLFLMITPVPQL